jgi:hypothetical protein
MDVCRLHLRSIYSMSSRSVEDFLSIENQLYTCYYYARLESPTTDIRSDDLFDSDCMRLLCLLSPESLVSLLTCLSLNTVRFRSILLKGNIF